MVLGIAFVRMAAALLTHKEPLMALLQGTHTPLSIALGDREGSPLRYGAVHSFAPAVICIPWIQGAKWHTADHHDHCFL